MEPEIIHNSDDGSADESVRSGAGVPEDMLFGTSEEMQQIRRRAVHVADSDVPVLIEGESGTGKEVLAWQIHAWSGRRSCPMVKVNCRAFAGALSESKMFGFEAGVFTRALAAEHGLPPGRNRGTLLLDAIDEMDIGLQSQLLELLQDSCLSQPGTQQHPDIRVLCTSTDSIHAAVQKGAFRSDLYYRINVVRLVLPPLRDRRADIPNLATYFLQQYNERYRRNAPPLSKELVRLLLVLDWPGNIRELRNIVRRYVILGTEREIADELMQAVRPQILADTLSAESRKLKTVTRRVLEDLERKLIVSSLEHNDWNRRQAARELDISYRSLFYKMREFGLPTKQKLSGKHG